MKKGVGLCCVHYAVEIPKDKGGPELLKWIGGYYETGYSINPHWVAKFESAAAASDHPRREAVHDSRRVVLQHAVPPRE